MQFTPLKNFFSPELKSEYCLGLSYTVRPGNELLASLLPEWVDSGLVKLGGPDVQPTEKISGSGNVQITKPQK